MKIKENGTETELIKLNSKRKVQEVGTSFTVTMPKETVKAAGNKSGDGVDVWTDYKGLVLIDLRKKEGE